MVLQQHDDGTKSLTTFSAFCVSCSSSIVSPAVLILDFLFCCCCYLWIFVISLVCLYFRAVFGSMRGVGLAVTITSFVLRELYLGSISDVGGVKLGVIFYKVVFYKS